MNRPAGPVHRASFIGPLEDRAFQVQDVFVSFVDQAGSNGGGPVADRAVQHHRFLRFHPGAPVQKRLHLGHLRRLDRPLKMADRVFFRRAHIDKENRIRTVGFQLFRQPGGTDLGNFRKLLPNPVPDAGPVRSAAAGGRPSEKKDGRQAQDSFHDGHQ